jgi:hypothetical protein
VSPRGVHDLREGKALKGKVQKRLRREIEPWNLRLLETAEGLRKPESGTEVELTLRLKQGAHAGMPSKGRTTSRKVGSDRQVGQSRGGDETLEGIRSRAE